MLTDHLVRFAGLNIKEAMCENYQVDIYACIFLVSFKVVISIAFTNNILDLPNPYYKLVKTENSSDIKMFEEKDII